MNNTAKKYKVKSGDTLWKIAESHFGDGKHWPSIAKENKLHNPNVIFAGQSLSLPKNPTSKALPFPVSPNIGLNAAKPVAFPTLDFDLADERFRFTIPLGVAKIEIKLKGNLSFQKKGVISDLTISDLKKLELKAKAETANGAQTLINEMKITFDPAKKGLSLTGGLVSVLKLPGGGSLKHSVEIVGKKIKFSAEPSPVTGHYKDLVIEGTFGYEISIENYDQLLQPALVPVRSPSYSVDWGKVITITLIVVVVAACLVLVAKLLPYAIAAAGAIAVGAISFLQAWNMVSRAVPLLAR